MDNLREAAALWYIGNEGRACLCVQEEPVADESPAEVKEEGPADADADLDSAAVKNDEGDDEGEAAADGENDEENEDPLAGMNKHAATKFTMRLPF